MFYVKKTVISYCNLLGYKKISYIYIIDEVSRPLLYNFKTMNLVLTDSGYNKEDQPTRSLKSIIMGFYCSNKSIMMMKDL